MEDDYKNKGYTNKSNPFRGVYEKLELSLGKAFVELFWVVLFLVGYAFLRIIFMFLENL